jgi:hypothetical protein
VIRTRRPSGRKGAGQAVYVPLRPLRPAWRADVMPIKLPLRSNG